MLLEVEVVFRIHNINIETQYLENLIQYFRKTFEWLAVMLCPGINNDIFSLWPAKQGLHTVLLYNIYFIYDINAKNMSFLVNLLGQVVNMLWEDSVLKLF